MLSAKKASKRKRRSKALPVLGAAGLSLSLVSGASATTDESTDMLARSAKQNQEITLAEEEIADVSLATFYVFDKERWPNIRLAATVQMACKCVRSCRATKSQSSGTQSHPSIPATKSRK
jgi:uncharacterized protein YdaU (DUF1376 family)